jgi:hypothetical protein
MGRPASLLVAAALMPASYAYARTSLGLHRMKKFARNSDATVLATIIPHVGHFFNPRSILSGLVLLALCAAECGAQQQRAGTGESAAADRQSAFRIRSDFDAKLNAAAGWAAALNRNAVVDVEKPFRLRFEVESAAEARPERRFRLQYRRNDGAWTDVGAERFPKPEKTRELTFGDHDAGPAPDGWRPVQGSASNMEVVAGEEPSLLAVRTGQEPLLAMSTSETRWAPSVFGMTVRLPEGPQSEAGLIFGYVDPYNYCRVLLSGNGVIRVSRIADGEETAVTEKESRAVSGQWREVEIEVDGDEANVEVGNDTFTAHLGDDIPASGVGLYVPPNSAAEFQEFVVEGVPRTPRVSIVESDTYHHGEETTDLLAGSDAPFRMGAGISLAETTPPLTAGSGQSEWEWPLVIRRFADGAVMNEEGDTFTFRMTDTSGRPVASSTYPTVTASVPPRLLGGTFVETPGRVGPWEASNGDLYFIMEPAETYNVLMVVKSTDGGRTWQEVDGANRPATGDLEGFGSDTHGDTIHMLHQTSDEVLHHAFRTSDHPTEPDTWVVRDDTVATPSEPPVQVATLTARSDGSLVAVYGGPEKIHFKIRSPEGRWGAETTVDAEGPSVLSGPQSVLGANDEVHLAYTAQDGTAWYRRIQPDGTLTPREQITAGLGTTEADVGAVLPLVFLPGTNTAVILYRRANGTLWARRIVDRGPPTAPVQVSEHQVVQNAVDSDQAGADAIAADGTVHVLFIEQDTGHIYHTQSDATGAWSPATLQVDSVDAQWIRGRPLMQGSDRASAYGYVYDAGSNGGSGMNHYAEVPLR